MHAPTFDPEMMQSAEISAVMREKDSLYPCRHRDRCTASQEVTILSRRVQYIRNMLQVLLRSASSPYTTYHRLLRMKNPCSEKSEHIFFPAVRRPFISCYILPFGLPSAP